MDFLKVDTLKEATEKLHEAAKSFLPKTVNVSLEDVLGKVLAQDVVSVENVPSFRRSTVDGYACVSKDTAAASESIPIFLTIKDEVQMGGIADVAITSGECVKIPTGGMLPQGADSVVMFEYCELFGTDSIAAYKGVGGGENVVQIGEDIKVGQVVLPRGKKIKAHDIGALAAIGVFNVNVFAPITLTIISTGDELALDDKELALGKVRDINSYSLAALAEEKGFVVVSKIVVKDEEEAFTAAIKNAMGCSDIIAISGSTSQGDKDMSAKIINRLAEPGVLTHGIAIKPGKPTILGHDSASNTLFMGLPGHPVAAIMVFELMVEGLRRKLTSLPKKLPIPASLSINVPSSPGRVTLYACVLELSEGKYTATPLFGKSGLISILANATGYFLIDRDTEGLKQGEMVFVHMF